MSSILLVEADRVVAGNIASSLKSAGHEVYMAKEPQAAIIQADKNLPDLVICDLLLAGRSGVEFLYEFVSYPEWRTIPIILLSSVPEAEVNTSGQGFSEINIARFIYKPQASLAEIVDAVNTALKR